MKEYTQNNFLAYLLILLTFFVILFFTKNIYSQMQVRLDTKEVNLATLSEKQSELSRLNELKKSLDQEWNELLEEVAWFTGEFSDSAMLEYIYSYAQQVNLWNDRIIIRGITLNGGEVSDLGFNKADINVTAVVSSEKTLFAFINYLTNKNATYRFHITEFSYPMNESTSNIQVSLPLTLYYK